MNDLRRSVLIALSGLGETPEDIAAFLTIGGWIGLRHSTLSCPIAMYLRSVMPNLATAAVSAQGVSVLTADGESVHLTTPRASARFVELFDDGAYDALDGRLIEWAMRQNDEEDD